MKLTLFLRNLSFYVLVCISGIASSLKAQTLNMSFNPVAFSDYINAPIENFTQAFTTNAEGKYMAVYNGKSYQLSAKADSKALLEFMQLIPDNGTKNDVIDILNIGKDAALPLGGFMGTKFSGTSGGIKKTVDETIDLLNNANAGLRISSIFNPKAGVYFVIDYQDGNYKLVLTRNVLPLYVDELAALVGTNFEQFYQEHFYISNKVNMFGMISLYFDAVRNSDNVNFNMNCEADGSKEKIKEISIYLNKNDNLNIDKSIEIWKKEVTAFLAIFNENPVKIYSTDVFGSVKQNFSTLEEAINFVTTNQRKDGVIVSVEVGMNVANLIINQKNVYYLLQQNSKKPAVVVKYNLPADSPLSFEIEANAEVLVDWGDGNQVNAGSNQNMISGKLRGSEVKLYGDILSFNCESTNAQALDISGAPNMSEILCAHNNIDKLMLSYNPKLKSIDCEKNRLTSLNTSKLVNLEKLLCSENQLHAIDISNNKALKRLMIADNGLTTLDVSCNKKLNVLNCSNNNIETLDLQENGELLQLIAGNNKLSTIDLTKCAQLERLVLKGNALNEINLENMPNLQFLDVSKNKLRRVELAKMNNLVECMLQSNELTTVNAQNMPAVMRLNVACNKLEDLDVEKNIKLRDLYIYGNTMKHDATLSIAQTIYDRSGEGVPGHIYVVGSNLSQDNQIAKSTASMLIGKNWEMYRIEEDSEGNLQEFLLTVEDFEDLPSSITSTTDENNKYTLQGRILGCNEVMTGIQVYNLAGKLVDRCMQKGLQYDLCNLPNGIYVFVISDKNDKQQVLKITLK